MDKWSFGFGVILCVTTLEGLAIYKGIDGAYFGAIMTMIGATAGALLGFTVNVKKEVKGVVENKKKKD